MKTNLLIIGIFVSLVLVWGKVLGLFFDNKSVEAEKIILPSPTPTVDITPVATATPSVKQIKKQIKQFPTTVVLTPTVTVTNTNTNSSNDSQSNSSSSDTTVDVCASLTNTSYDSTILIDTPLLYLPFEGGEACDHSVNKTNGVKTGSVQSTTMPNGDSAVVFDGSTGYVTVADNDLLSVPTIGKLTVEAWVRPDTLQFSNFEGSGYIHWLGKGESNNHEYHLRMYNLTNSESRPNRISGYGFNSTGGLGVGSYFQDSVSVGEWIHVVFVINTVDTDASYPTGFTKIYKNGTQRDKDSLSTLNIVPTNGAAPFRIGTRDLSSFLQGAVGKVAVYGYELSPYQVLQHYQKMVPPVLGSASFVQTVGKNSTKSLGTSILVSVSQPVSVGNTLVARVVTDFAATAPTIADSKGNVYTRDRTAPNSPNTMRASIYSSPVTNALQTGDIITITTPNVAAKAVVVDEFKGLLSSAFVDKTNGTSGSSTLPGASISITTTAANELILGFVAVEGPVEDTYIEDSLGQFASLTREGLTGDADDTNLTINGGYKSVGSVGTYSYRPTLEPTRNWIDFVVSYFAAN